MGRVHCKYFLTLLMVKFPTGHYLTFNLEKQSDLLYLYIWRLVWVSIFASIQNLIDNIHRTHHLDFIFWFTAHFANLTDGGICTLSWEPIPFTMRDVCIVGILADNASSGLRHSFNDLICVGFGNQHGDPVHILFVHGYILAKKGVEGVVGDEEMA